MQQRRHFRQTEPLEKRLTDEQFACARKPEALRQASSVNALCAEPDKLRLALKYTRG